MVANNYGYNIYEGEGLLTGDIISVGAMGGINVIDLGSGNTLQGLQTINTKIGMGQTVMMTFFGGSADHAVIVDWINTTTGTVYDIDPQQDGASGSQPQGQWSGFYSIQ